MLYCNVGHLNIQCKVNQFIIGPPQTMARKFLPLVAMTAHAYIQPLRVIYIHSTYTHILCLCIWTHTTHTHTHNTHT